MNILNYVHNVSNIARKNKGKGKVVISVAGAGCIGKTTFAESFVRFAGSDVCQAVDLDGYMLEREERDRLGGITGYDPRGFELGKARAQLSALISSDTPFILNRYNRGNHKRDRLQLIEPKEIILIEGGLSLREEIFDLADIHIFFDTDRETQLSLRLKREQEEFGYDSAQVSGRFKKYYPDYMRFIHQASEKADIVLRVGKDYSISFVRNSPTVIMPCLDAIVYDLDGVLIDSRNANIAYFNSILRHFGMPDLNPQQEQLAHTLASHDAMRLLFHGETYEEAMQYKKQIPLRDFISLMALEPGVFETLEGLRGQFKMGIATGRQSSLAEVIDAFGFRDIFWDNIMSVEEVQRPKPHPDIILKLTEKMGVNPGRALYVGDSSLDYQCSENAGTVFCAYKHVVKGELSIYSHGELVPLIALTDKSN